MAGGIFTHPVHFQAPHWAVALAVDITTGAVVGVALAVAGVWFRRVGSRTA